MSVATGFERQEGQRRLQSVKEQPVTVDRVLWDDFLRWFMDVWEQGQHVSILGQTGQGKSELAKALLKERAKNREANIVVVGTKPKDSTMESFGWKRISSWPPDYKDKQVLLWPTYGDPKTVRQRHFRLFDPILRNIFMQGDRTVYFDEILHLEKRLGMKSIIEEFWQMGRSNNLTLVAGTQRPYFVSRSMFSEPTYVFILPLMDDDDVKRVSEIGGNTQVIREIVTTHLNEHEFLCVHRTKRQMLISKVER